MCVICAYVRMLSVVILSTTVTKKTLPLLSWQKVTVTEKIIYNTSYRKTISLFFIAHTYICIVFSSQLLLLPTGVTYTSFFQSTIVTVIVTLIQNKMSMTLEQIEAAVHELDIDSSNEEEENMHHYL